MGKPQPPHPGEIIREQCLTPLGLTVTTAARGLGVTRKALSELVNGHSGVSPEMAIRLAKAFGSTAEAWLRLQLQYDLAKAERKAEGITVRRFADPATA
ncbi:HigA family addiction module antitoxin [Desulfolutivibrio sulfoxidireducens]|uniref:HigA family addiction module antitoxin n=1 Tax=Desulfolutivibrio sulfoxidireducens TaxID=2773299 RepID=UPI00159DF696|nr:HigA family addiction module antitoxin [Desulfolutivibrio sulfoxidireducens]QLA17593.1 HigA family addiction module antidote protein [Desulfolutivibrio sulfoxidireducens]